MCFFFVCEYGESRQRLPVNIVKCQNAVFLLISLQMSFGSVKLADNMQTLILFEKKRVDFH